MSVNKTSSIPTLRNKRKNAFCALFIIKLIKIKDKYLGTLMKYSSVKHMNESMLNNDINLFETKALK